MEKLLNLTKRQVIAISWAAVAVGIAGILAMGAAASDHLRQVEAIHDHIPTVPADVEIKPDTKQKTKPTPAPQQNSSVADTQQRVEPKPVAAQPEPAKTEAGGHVPFTNKPVTPGDPQSYIDTVGQCPFYEMAGPKGCVPPSDIICNDDWTVCRPVAETLDKVGL